MPENGHIQLSTLEDLAAPIVNLEIETAYGRKGKVSLYLLTYHEWFSVVDDIVFPAIPHTRVDKQGNKLPNPDDATYKAAWAAANRRQNYRRLAYALAKGGMEIPGKTPDERAENVSKVIETSMAAALIGYLNATALGGRAAIEKQADNFQLVSNGTQSGTTPEKADAGDVE